MQAYHNKIKNINLSKTLDAYSNNWEEYISKTENLAANPSLVKWLNTFIDSLQGLKVVDIGFGSGRDLGYFISKGLEPEGIDLVPEFVTYAKQKYNIPILKMDVCNLNLPYDNYDGVWCCSSLLHLNDNQMIMALKNINKILKTDGSFYLSLKIGEGEEVILDENSNICCQARYFKYYDINTITEYLNTTGFEIINSDFSESIRKNGKKWVNLLCRKNHDYA